MMMTAGRHRRLLSTLLIYYCLSSSQIFSEDARKQSFIAVASTFSSQTRTFLARSRYAVATFAAGGFGGSTQGKAGGSKKKRKKAAKPTKKSDKGGHREPVVNLFTPEGRLAHINERINAADFSPLAKLKLSTAPNGQLALDVDPNAVCVVDNFLGPELISSLRSEAESLLPTMVPSQSTRWDEENRRVVAYEKHQVMSTQIEGGDAGYAASPRLVEYVVTLTQALSAKLNKILPEIYHLSGTEQTNKLAVCLGDGSSYDKHIDNLGGGDGKGDQRKLTALLYLQPPDSHAANYPDEKPEDDERGGYFRAYDVPEEGKVTSIAPKGDRLLLFWSDSLVHDVSPSYVPNGTADRRWALTVWFVVKEDGVIRGTDADVEKRHFGTG